MASQTIIEKLVTEIGFDTSKLDEGEKKANEAFDKVQAKSEETEKRTADAGKAQEKFFSGARSAALRFFAAFTAGAGAIGAFNSITKLNVAIGNLASETGQDVKSIKALSNIFEETGYSANEAQAGFSNFSQSVANLQAGQGLSGVLVGLTKLGVAFMDAQGNARDWGDVLVDAGKKAKAMSGGDAAKAARLMQSWGFDAASANVATAKSADQRYNAEKRNVTLTKSQIQQSKAFLKAQKDIGQAFEKVQQVIITNLAPAIKTVLNGIVKFSDFITDHGDAMTAVFVSLGAAVTALSLPFVAVCAKVALVIGAVAGLATALSSLKMPDWLTDLTGWVGENLGLTEAGESKGAPNTPNSIATPSKASARAMTSAKAVKATAQSVNTAVSNTSNNTTGFNTKNINVGGIVINTKATDAKGIAKDVSRSLRGELGTWSTGVA